MKLNKIREWKDKFLKKWIWISILLREWGFFKINKCSLIIYKMLPDTR
ncbi:MAG: hypothetical protein JWP81_3126 [Ferruginibacter sp.]|nr:hypothetical protein [Ferruginibacter sp.]